MFLKKVVPGPSPSPAHVLPVPRLPCFLHLLEDALGAPFLMTLGFILALFLSLWAPLDDRVSFFGVFVVLLCQRPFSMKKVIPMGSLNGGPAAGGRGSGGREKRHLGRFA